MHQLGFSDNRLTRAQERVIARLHELDADQQILLLGRLVGVTSTSTNDVVQELAKRILTQRMLDLKVPPHRTAAAVGMPDIAAIFEEITATPSMSATMVRDSSRDHAGVIF